jgi:hypothetical protein
MSASPSEQNTVISNTYSEITHINAMLKSCKKLKNQILQSQIHHMLIEELNAKHEFINQVKALGEVPRQLETED